MPNISKILGRCSVCGDLFKREGYKSTLCDKCIELLRDELSPQIKNQLKEMKKDFLEHSDNRKLDD